MCIDSISQAEGKAKKTHPLLIAINLPTICAFSKGTKMVQRPKQDSGHTTPARHRQEDIMDKTPVLHRPPRRHPQLQDTTCKKTSVKPHSLQNRQDANGITRDIFSMENVTISVMELIATIPYPLPHYRCRWYSTVQLTSRGKGRIYIGVRGEGGPVTD